MSKRLLIAMIMGSSIIVGIIIASSFLKPNHQTIYALVSVLFLLYLALYVFGGLAKLIVFFIYGVLIAITLALVPERYSLVIIFMGSLIFVSNPLAEFEAHLSNTLSDAEIEPVRIRMIGKFEAFYQYRKEMKDHYHLPQTRKLYTKAWYQRARTLTVLALFGVDIFLLLFVANDIAYFQEVSLSNILGIYFLTIIFIMIILLHKKGFTTMMRAVRLSVFVPIIYIIALIENIDPTIRIVFITMVSIFGLTLAVIEIVKYFSRVSYSAYKYYDSNRQEIVYANALFESLVYNEQTTEIGHYGIEVSLESFQAHFNEILIYANLHHFIITAYTHNKKYAYIFAEFIKGQEKRMEKFKVFLEGIYKTHVGLREYSDSSRKFYETRFFHNPEYIVTRALNLAHLLNELEIRGEVIISIVLYFISLKDLQNYQKKYISRRLEELDQPGVYTIQTNLKCRNLDYLIETAVRDILLESMRNNGTFVRIMIYY
ncbi:MAG: hypothetical protein RBQ91_00920 [Acholeplasma sp.]|nr:hypothetical protein [Acholeplasma sp.]